MPLEKGGRADKAGNRYEIKCIVYELLNLINETNYSVEIEALGDDEKGTDILVTYFNGIKEHQQCKVRNASKEYWDISDLKSRNIFDAWINQLERDNNRQVAVVSPIGCSFLVDLHDRALNSNGNPQDFYGIQIQKSSKEFIKFYQDFCSNMGLEYTKDSDVSKSIEFLKRINCKQISEYVIKELINQKIEFYFCSDRDVVYNALVTYVIDGDILGKEITASIVLNYLAKQNIELRLLDGDKRLIPQINAINCEYRNSFKSLKQGMIYRKEFDQCINAIKNEDSLIITGNAGYGKSGCTESVIDYCENEKIPYIALKLDRRIPQKNCENWGKSLGFSTSIAYVLHTVAKNNQAVIILDQLDALRWTQANSSEALSVCMELLKQVDYLNYERERKIVIVFVCRAYDLHNDNNIKNLFTMESNSKQGRNEWNKVVVDSFDEEVVKNIVGDKFKKLTIKTRKLLQIPSNLYIWQHLDEDETYDDCITTSHLIEKWYQQICRKSISVGVQEKVVIDTQEHIVNVLDKIGRLYAPKSILKIEETGFDYLISVEMIVADGSRVGFVHQSILDYFISKRMVQQYFENKSIEEIIGEKNKQTPNKRYQIQMFLQNLLEFDSTIFVTAGKKMLESDNVRYYVKYVFYEILGQIVHPDENIKEFVARECNADINADYMIKNVVLGNRAYISTLREYGIIEKWFIDQKKKKIVFDLLRSISPDLDIQDIDFIKKYSLISEEDDVQFMDCFLHDITEESDALFELRMYFYQKYPEWSLRVYIDMKAMMKKCEVRVIRLISFWLKNKIQSNGRNSYRYEEELLDEVDISFVENSHFILDELLQYIPQDDSIEVLYSDWSGRNIYKKSLERVVVGLIKKANKAIIEENPDTFLIYYEPYMGKNYAIYNEIILHGLQFMPKSYSNKIIHYLSSDVDNKIFDYTSGAKNQLDLVASVIEVHTALCDDIYLINYEKMLRKYVSPRAVDWYKRRIEHNKAKEDIHVYWSYWGDLQYQLLVKIPYERLSDKSRNLMGVLERKFNGKSYLYMNGNSHSGGVSSPVSGKKIGQRQWLQIITNNKLKKRECSHWKEVPSGFIESSIEMYSADFNSAVKEEPELMIEMLLDNNKDIVAEYIDSMYSGVEYSERLAEVSQQTLEEMFKKFPFELESYRASAFCGIIENANIYSWSQEVLVLLKAIASDARDVMKKEEQMLDCEKLYCEALNCIRGKAARAIRHLLWDNKELFAEFKDVIDKFVLDDNPAVRMSSFYMLWPCYNIDKKWAEERILSLYESDIRMAGYPDSKEMFFRLYSMYKERVLAIIRKCFESNDKGLIQIGGCALCEFFLRYGEFEEEIAKIEQLNEEQLKAILHMAINYLEVDEHRDKAKSIILKYKDSECEYEYPLSRMFGGKLVDVERDSEFLQEIMNSNVSNTLVYSFVAFLEENAFSIKDYADVVLTLCENVLGMRIELITKQWGIEANISKLIMALYDECANSEKENDKRIAEKCLELWDIMFEKQIGKVRELSRKLMER